MFVSPLMNSTSKQQQVIYDFFEWICSCLNEEKTAISWPVGGFEVSQDVI